MLDAVQRQMLEAEEFHIDGWTSQRGHAAARKLHELGFVTNFKGGDSQYTAINYRITEAGKAALEKEPPQ